MARRIVISGASGLIGSALASSLRADGFEVTSLVRRPPRSEDEAQWEPGESALDPEVLAGADAVVALGGASVGRLPWTRGYRQELIDVAPGSDAHPDHRASCTALRRSGPHLGIGRRLLRLCARRGTHRGLRCGADLLGPI